MEKRIALSNVIQSFANASVIDAKELVGGSNHIDLVATVLFPLDTSMPTAFINISPYNEFV